jgi:membrane protein DedA with SNARE-associated domain
MERILDVPPLLAYVLIVSLVFGEAAVFLGFILPGETAVVLGGVLASRGQVSIVLLAGLVVVSAVLGDSVGYEVGRHFGERVLHWRYLRPHRERLDGARAWLGVKGAPAVFVGRWTAFLRAVTPGLAGVSRMPYRRFLLWNAIGGLVWGVTFCLVGYLAGNSYEVLAKRINGIGAAATLTAVGVGVVVWLRRRHRAGDAASG